MNLNRVYLCPDPQAHPTIFAAHISPLYLPCISPVSPLCLPAQAHPTIFAAQRVVRQYLDRGELMWYREI